MITFKTIAGVLVTYDRDSHEAYGTRGRPVKAGGPVTPAFFAALQAWMDALTAACPWGRPELLVTGGIHGDGHGRHGEGRAIDIDAIYWAGRPPLVTLRALQQPALYLAVEATLRAAFGTVLDHWYNAAHRDHWHVDDGRAPGWRHGSRSLTVFVQAALVHLWGRALVIDGVWGPKTEAAARDAGLQPDGAWWCEFLAAVAERGFAAG